MSVVGRNPILVCFKSLLLLLYIHVCGGWLLAAPLRHGIDNCPHRAQAPSGKRPWSTGLSLSSSASSSSSSSASENYPIRYLGRGEHAIVRPGVVLLAPREEYHHFLREAAVFVYGMGYDDDDTYVIRGAIIDHPTPFTMEEMRQKNPNNENDVCALYENLLFRGGDVGGESVFMLHSDNRLAETAGNEMIGSSGIYQGGFESALAGNQDNLNPEQFKFFFNYMEFTEKELENMLGDPQEDGDAWMSVECPPEIVLSTDWSRGDAWRQLRNSALKFQ